MRKKIKNEIKEMVANSDWANLAPDNDNYTMSYIYPMEVNNTNNNEEIGVPKAVLICRQDSHPFPKRTLLLNQPVKVGRAVGKIKAAPDNAIFDCKVLSRHHASLWYSNGKFYLQDTKSSNGTFVNNHRLSEGTKESPPYEVCSRDVVQFGVDVLENLNKITHGCIIATLRLYLPDGKEALPSPRPAGNMEDLCVLNNVLQEALQRESLLEGKLVSLRQIVMSCGSALSEAWRALCCEERLVARVHFLERRLAAVSTNQQQPNELQQLLDDKHQYELNAREALQSASEEKLKLLNQLGSIQWSMCSSEEECAVLRGHVERAHRDLQELGEKKSVIETDLNETKKALVAAEKLIERMVDLLKESKNENGYPHSEEVESIATIGEESSLPDALKDLSKHVKSLLPDQLIEKVTNNAKIPNHITQLENKIYFLKKELFELESINAVDIKNDNTSSGQSNIQDLTNTKSENKENSEYINSTENSDTEKDYIDTEGNGYIMDNSCIETNLDKTLFLDKLGAEATKEMKTKLIRDKINELTEEINLCHTEEGSTQMLVILQTELSHAETKISNISKELETVNNDLLFSNQKINQLTLVNDELTTENVNLKQNFSNKAEECRKLEIMLSQTSPEEMEKSDENDDQLTKYKNKVMELETKLEEVLESKASGSQEIERLNILVEGLQKDLQGRPLSCHVEEQSRLVDTLNQRLRDKETLIQDLNKQLSLLTDIQITLEDKLNKLSAQPVVADKLIMTEQVPDTEIKGPIVISSSLAAVNLLENQKLLNSEEISDTSSLSVDLQRLTELEEELVDARERCALLMAEEMQTSKQLLSVNEKYNKLLKRSLVDMLVYILPLVGIIIYLLMYQYIS